MAITEKTKEENHLELCNNCGNPKCQHYGINLYCYSWGNRSGYKDKVFKKSGRFLGVIK